MSNKRLEGKVAVITGGTSGIGLATAKLFVDNGARVAVTGSSESSVEAARAELGDRALVARSDAADLGAIDELVAQVAERFGAVDVLFVNAGIAHFAPLAASSPEFYDRIFNLNVRGALFSVQKFLPHLSKGASVIFTTSAVNSKGLPGASVYAATKAALRSITRTLAAELSPDIRVNALSPGPIETPIYGKMGMPAEALDAFAADVVGKVPLARFGASREVAGAALFLASDDSTYITGSELSVDGGFGQI